jgi:hypothetical protein
MLCNSLETKEKRIALIPGTSGLSSIFYRYITLSLPLRVFVITHSLSLAHFPIHNNNYSTK